MQVYDIANKLAEEIRKSEEYLNLKRAKENLNPEIRNKIQEFEKARYEEQLEEMQTGKQNESKMHEVQEKYIELIKIQEAKEYFDTEIKFNILLADVNKIISESVSDII